MNDERLEDLLVEWELARQAGNDVSAGALCADHPELTGELQQRIDDLRATAWMLAPSSHDAGHASHVAFTSPDEPLPRSNRTAQEFFESLEASRILSDSRLKRVRDEHLPRFVAEPCGELVEALIGDRVLTRYQARVLLEENDEPLTLDRYVILESIGAGGMGVVYKARHISMDRIVAVKVLPRRLEEASHTIRRFQREIKATARLSHPNIVAALDAHESDGTHFLVMEYVDARNLTDTVRDRGPLSVIEAVEIMRQIADALAEAHRNGIVHRDIKPSNILLQPDGQAKLLDLGLARISRVNADDITVSALTEDGLAMGTEAFMPPEQARDSKAADARSDIYSLGCTLFYLLTGRPLFLKPTPVLTMIAHRDDVPASLDEVCDETPLELDALFRRMVSKSPEDRPQSMNEIADALSAIASEDSSIEADRTSGSTGSRPRRMLVGLFSLLFLAVLALGMQAYLTLNQHRTAGQWIVDNNGYFDGTTILGEYVVSDTGLPGIPFRITLAVLDDRAIGSLAPLENLSYVDQVTITGKPLQLYDIEVLAGLPNLLSLDVPDCDVDDDAMEILARRSLLNLDVSGNPISDVGLKRIAGWKNLMGLFVADTDITDEGLNLICRFQHIQQLDVSGTKITGEAVANLRNLNRLDSLSIARTDVSDTQAVVLKHLDLLSLEISDCPISDATVDLLIGMPRLSSLALSRTNVTSDGIVKLASLRELTRLELAGQQVTPDAIETIAGLQSLESLDLSDTNLDDDGLKTLGRLRALHELKVQGTSVSLEAVSEFVKANYPIEVLFNGSWHYHMDMDVIPDMPGSDVIVIE